METLLIILDALYARVLSLDQSQREGTSQKDFEKACLVVLLVAVWAFVCFVLLYVVAAWNGIICAVLFVVGWGVISLFGKRYLRKVEDPEKKRFYLYGLLFPKKPPKK